MNRYTDRHMDRRIFLKTAACVAGAWTLPRGATARRLVLVGVDSSEKISRIEWLPYDTGQRGPDEQNQQRCAVRLTTTGGAQGWADLAITTLPDADAATLVSDTLLAQDPASQDNLWRQLYQQGLALGTLAAVDVALWDLRGRMEGEPVHALLGTRRPQVKTCLNTGFNLGAPADYAHHAGQCQSSGIGSLRRHCNTPSCCGRLRSTWPLLSARNVLTGTCSPASGRFAPAASTTVFSLGLATNLVLQ